MTLEEDGDGFCKCGTRLIKGSSHQVKDGLFWIDVCRHCWIAWKDTLWRGVRDEIVWNEDEN